MVAFHVERTSGRSDDTPPCEVAERRPVVRQDWRTKPVNKLHPSVRETWFSQGTNHREEGGWSCRDFPDEAWFIDLADLDALFAFCDRYGDVIVGTSRLNRSVRSLEIYDDYRE